MADYMISFLKQEITRKDAAIDEAITDIHKLRDQVSYLETKLREYEAQIRKFHAKNQA
jgi:phage shock protein A